MKRIVFYSWQSDLPNSTNRGFIQKALEDAAKAIAADESVAVEPVVDRDTLGVPGAPNIAATILAKIAAADLMVADVSIISRPDAGRPTPNPNVLIELGYALKAMGHERLVLVFNAAFGRVEELPFDLRMSRVVTYDMPEGNTERAPVRGDLRQKLEGALRTALEHLPLTQEAAIAALLPIETKQPNRVLVLRRNLDEVFSRLSSTEPRKFRDGGTVEELLNGIAATQEVVAEFSKIAAVAAVMDDAECALEMQHWLGNVLDRYDLPNGFSGPHHTSDFDYFKFLGHELQVTLVAFFLKERRWDTLTRMLNEPVLLRDSAPQRHGAASWSYASEFLRSLGGESKVRGRVSLHADILKERHTTGSLGSVLQFDEFAAADFFSVPQGGIAARCYT